MPGTQAEGSTDAVKHRVMVKKIGFELIDEIYQVLITDEDRNTSMVPDIVQAVEAKRSPQGEPSINPSVPI